VRPRTVGILGGMGPEATILLMSRVLALTPARDDADHVPLVVDNNTQVPSRIKALIEGGGEDPAPVLIDMAQRLEAYGAEALAMPCNTAHHYAPQIAAAVEVPFIDMVALATAGAALTARGSPVGILGSPAVRLTGLFDAALARHGATALYPRDEPRILSAIRSIKAGAADGAATQIAAAAVDELATAGAGAILIACTEFSIIAGALPRPVPLIDTIDVLAEAIVRFAREA